MRSGVFKSLRKEINNSVCEWGGGRKAEGRGEEERGRGWWGKLSQRQQTGKTIFLANLDVKYQEILF